MSRYKKTDGGGVLIAVKKTLACTHKVNWQTTVEDVWVSIQLDNFKLHICTVYLPSYLTLDDYGEFIDKIDHATSTNTDKFLILGDFNLEDVNWSELTDLIHTNGKERKLRELMERHELLQANHVLNANGKILDLALHDSQLLTSVSKAISLSKLDNHHPCLDVTVHTKVSLLKENIGSKYKFRCMDFAGCNSELLMIDWEQYCDLDQGDLLHVFCNHLWEAIDKHTPKSRSRQGYPPWFSNALIKNLKEKDKYHDKYLRYNNPRDFDTFSMLRGRVKRNFDICFKLYIKRVEESLKTDTKFFWKYSKSKKSSNDLPCQMFYNTTSADKGKDIADLFARHFASVYNRFPTTSFKPDFPESTNSISSVTITHKDIEMALKTINVNKGAGPDGIPPVVIKSCAKALIKPLGMIFNKSLLTETFPELWKLGKIVPVFKTGNKNDVVNYRPISILSAFAKIFESIVYKHIFGHLKPIISEKQHGFIKGRSTTTNHMTYAHYLHRAFNNHTQVDALYTDFSKAFDKVDHFILCRKAEHLGIHGSLLRWLESYVTNRTQLVTVYGYESTPFEATSGIPQGSNLGPLLFLLYVNDLIESITCNCLAYADDIKIYNEVKTVEDCIKLQVDIDRVYGWCILNNMTLNIDKCHLITFTKKRNPVKYNYAVNGTFLCRKDSVKDLGVWLDGKLTYTGHIDFVITKARKTLNFIFRITKPFRDPNSIIALYVALARNILEYCSVVWSPYYETHIDRVEAVQKWFLRRLCSKLGLRRKLDTYEARLKHFQLHSLETRRKLNDFTILHKILNAQWDTSELLSHFSINIRGSARTQKLFCVPGCSNRASYNDPVFRLCRAYNDISKQLDVFSNLPLYYKNVLNNIR